MTGTIDEQIARWREQMSARPGVATDDVDELEDHLRGHLDSLTAVGLTPDEAFLVAVQRVGAQHAIAADLAREHSERLWRQHVGTTTERPAVALLPTLGFAAAAGIAVKIPVTIAIAAKTAPALPIYLAVLLGLTVVVAAYFSWLRRPPVLAALVPVGIAVVSFAVTQPLYPYVDPKHTMALAMLHMPITLAVALAAPYLGRDWRVIDRWLDYVRFLGELAIYLALIAMGGGVLMGLTAGVLPLIGLNPETLLQEWVLPLGVGGAVIVAAWLVEAKKSVLENMAPVLSMVFTPLFTLLLVGFLAAMLVTGRLVSIEREVLITIDLLLVVVLGLHLYAISARRHDAPPGLSDWLQITLVVSALVINAVVLAAMAGRIGEYGASPNKLAALGENLVLAGILAGSAWLSLGFVRGKRPFADLERWHCRGLLVIGAWAAIVVLVFPVAFGFR